MYKVLVYVFYKTFNALCNIRKWLALLISSWSSFCFTMECISYVASYSIIITRSDSASLRRVAPKKNTLFNPDAINLQTALVVARLFTRALLFTESSYVSEVEVFECVRWHFFEIVPLLIS